MHCQPSSSSMKSSDQASLHSPWFFRLEPLNQHFSFNSQLHFTTQKAFMLCDLWANVPRVSKLRTPRNPWTALPGKEPMLTNSHNFLPNDDNNSSVHNEQNIKLTDKLTTNRFPITAQHRCPPNSPISKEAQIFKYKPTQMRILSKDCHDMRRSSQLLRVPSVK